MSMTKDRSLILALAHARLKATEDMLRWVMSAEVADLIPCKEHGNMLKRLEE